MNYKDGNKLFPNKKRPSDFSAFVTKIFTKNTYKHVTATNLRSIYLTDYYNSGQKNEEYNRIADMMVHSRKQQGQYRKIIKDDNHDSSVPSSVPSSTVPLVFFSFFFYSSFSFFFYSSFSFVSFFFYSFFSFFLYSSFSFFSFFF